MPHGFTTRGGWLVDREGRRALLRGVNLGGSSKVPFRPDGATHRGVDFRGWRDVSFVGRPFPLEEADRHLDRIAGWGFGVLRLLTTWEAIEHAGPGVYDEAYLDYFREVVRKAGERGLLVFVDPHHDVWSRFTGGDGAPFWCFEEAGLLPERFVDAEAVELDALDWPSNSQRVPCATMWTLLLAGDAFCPELAGAQERLQSRYVGALCALAERVAEFDHVLGYDSFNEPLPGYVGRGDDLRRDGRFMGEGPPACSALEHLAAADGHAVRCTNGRLLNPKGVSIWRRGCPWRRLGVWDLDAEGRPALARRDHFLQVGGRPVTAWSDFLVPFLRRIRAALRRVHPDCILFLEGVPGVLEAPWEDPDPLVVDARHWYDVFLLGGRRFDPDDHPVIGGRVSGLAELAQAYTKQLGGLKRLSQSMMGNLPVLVGELGIPYEMNAGEAYRSGDYRKHELVLDATYRALDETFLSSTQWNYTADNSHAHGDGWNREDLSIFSPDDVRDPTDLDSGGRATRAFVRPYGMRFAGQPLRMAFDLVTGRFELELESDAAQRAPTLVHVPRLHYGAAPRVVVSAGIVRHDARVQRLEWDTRGVAGPVSLRLERAA
ncbi:MAG TPA: cellulase family glycosylhydrolase [Myxococcota bacterium]|jgi:hypothetical protein|nr:cellulase family glycosylhydrolase [Myxococcota bacterium]